VDEHREGGKDFTEECKDAVGTPPSSPMWFERHIGAGDIL
jgi:hypothetical protein